MIGYGLSVLGGLAFCGIGAGAILAPAFSSEQYGLATRQPDALGYVRALGVRDLVFGGCVLALAAARNTDGLAVVIGLTIAVGLGDFVIVARERGSGATKSLVTHAVGTAALLVAFGLLKAGI